MKLKLLWIIVIHIILVSCNEDDNETFVNQEFMNELSGIYTLKTAILNEPIDINGDGIENTDFFEEYGNCETNYPLEWYRSTFEFGELDYLQFEFPRTSVDFQSQEFTTCMWYAGVIRQVEIDQRNETVSLIPNEYEEDFILNEFRAMLKEFTWVDRTMYLSLEIEFYTFEGIWKKTDLLIAYEWTSES